MCIRDRRCPHQFIHGIVPPNILAQAFQFAAEIETRRGVQTSGAFEDTLSAPECARQPVDDFRRELDVVRRQDGTRIRFQILQGRLPADAARGRHHEVTLSLNRRLRPGGQLHHLSLIHI